MQRFLIAAAFTGIAWFATGVSSAQAAPCLLVTLTGTMSGPVLLNGVAGAGTLVRYGDDSDGCAAVHLQFDAGRGTSLRLSQVNVEVGQLDAIFFTHMHSDHTDGFADLMQARWNWNPKGPRLDVVCSADAVSQPFGFTMSCSRLVAHIADAFIQSGEIAQRVSEDKNRPAGGPAEMAHLITFEPGEEPQIVWSKGEVKVSAIRSTHVAGHASYRVDTPAGSVVIGGDAGNDTLAPPRASSTSAQVERLAQGADIIVHSTMHPVMSDRSSGMPPLLFLRQSNPADLGAMAKRVGAKHLMLTHLAPQPGSPRHGPWKVPGGGITEADYRKAVAEGGFTGDTIVGSDLATLRLPAK